jgi:cell division transport system permease protein
MTLGSVEFLAGEAVRNIARHRLSALVAVTTVMISLLVLGGFFIGAKVALSVASNLEQKLELRVFCEKGLKLAEVGSIERRISQLPGVKQIIFVPKEKAWPEFSSRFKDAELMASVQNPLPDAFRVKVREATAIELVGKQIRQIAGVKKVNDSRELAERVVSVANLFRAGTVTSGLVLGLLMVLGISNTLQLAIFARRREIAVMRLVGATRWFIGTPFLIEGAIFGALGGIGASIVLGVVGRMAFGKLAEAAPIYSSTVGDLPFWPLALLCVGLGGLVGVLGSASSIRRYLREV